jgi:hypothetical protein
MLKTHFINIVGVSQCFNAKEIHNPHNENNQNICQKNWTWKALAHQYNEL